MTITYSAIINLGLDFVKNFIGIINQPYATYRKIVKSDPYQLFFIFTLIAGYFSAVSPIKTRSLHPLLLTASTSRMFTIALTSYILICLTILVLGKVFKSESNLKAVMLAWGYSLFPTLIWFLVTTFFYVVLPPPRQQTILGNLFSVVFIAFSLSLFFWKGLLYYLTLRFALRLSLQKIIAVSVMFIPLIFGYSVFLYKMGIFKVPFI
jgi:hypothetical protein